MTIHWKRAACSSRSLSFGEKAGLIINLLSKIENRRNDIQCVCEFNYQLNVITAEKNFWKIVLKARTFHISLLSLPKCSSLLVVINLSPSFTAHFKALLKENRCCILECTYLRGNFLKFLYCYFCELSNGSYHVFVHVLVSTTPQILLYWFWISWTSWEA